jgi:phosphoenolpyruvate-protein phosphotransferase (PTS system enzyme I)
LADAKNGRLIIHPTPADEQLTLPKSHRTAEIASSASPLIDKYGQAVTVMINLASLHELENLDCDTVDGIGLVRTEFMFAGQNHASGLAGEDTQFEAYCKILAWAKGKPVFIRTIDAGGDKPLAAFVGGNAGSKLRGIRFSLATPDQFCVQIRALLRAAHIGPLLVTLPMVASTADFDEAVALFESEARALEAAGIAHAMPPIGIMVEVPAVALTLENFANSAHFAIGTNDLMQYTLAEPRDTGGEKSSIDHPAVLGLIKRTVGIGQALGKPVSVCGDAASDSPAIDHLLNAGVVHFSVSPPSRFRVRQTIRAYLTENA